MDLREEKPDIVSYLGRRKPWCLRFHVVLNTHEAASKHAEIQSLTISMIQYLMDCDKGLTDEAGHHLEEHA
ncbi:hypothetical protein GCM10027449_21330 [Sinomonas notoginsengisoli]